MKNNPSAISNKTIYRNGSASKLISFTHSPKQRTFEYQCIDSAKMIEITGNARNHVKTPPMSEEISLFQHIRRYPQHDTSRTINPENAPQIPIKRCRSNANICFTTNNKSPLFFSNENTNRSLKRRANNPEVYKTNNLFDNDKNDKEIHDNSISLYKRMTKANEYKRYDNTSQIVGLPGGRKRNEYAINYNNEPFIKTTHTPCFASKVNKDYKSNVTCLLGSGVVTDYNYKKPIMSYKYPTSDIFNANPCIKANDTIISESRKKFLNKTNQQSIQMMHQHKCYSLKNISQIQLA